MGNQSICKSGRLEVDTEDTSSPSAFFGQLTDERAQPAIRSLSVAEQRPSWLPRRGSLCRDPLLRSVSVAQAVRFLRACTRTFSWEELCQEKGEYAITTYDIKEHFVLPWLAGTGCACMAELINAEDNREPCVALIIHPWRGSIVELHNCLLSMVNHHGLSPSTRVFLSFLSVDLRPDGEFTPTTSLIPRLSDSLGVFVVHASTENLYQRLWMVVELALSTKHGLHITGLFDADRWTNAKFDDLLRTRIETSKSDAAKHDTFLHKFIEDTFGSHHVLDLLIHDLQQRVRPRLKLEGQVRGKHARNWVLRKGQAHYVFAHEWHQRMDAVEGAQTRLARDTSLELGVRPWAPLERTLSALLTQSTFLGHGERDFAVTPFAATSLHSMGHLHQPQLPWLLGAPSDPTPASNGQPISDPMRGIIGWAPLAEKPAWLPRGGKGIANVDPPCWSLTIEHWIFFLRAVAQTATWSALARCKGEYNVTTYDLCQHFVEPWTMGTGCSIASLMEPDAQPVELMLSHAWGGSVMETYNCLMHLVDHDGVPAQTRVFFCTLCMYQCGDDAPGKSLTISQQLERDPFAQIIHSNPSRGMRVIHTTIFEVYTRLWAVFEVSQALAEGVQALGVFDLNRWTPEQFDASVRIKTECSQCQAQDRAMLVARIKATHKRGFEDLDNVIAEFRARMLDDLRFAAHIHDWVRDPQSGLIRWKHAPKWAGEFAEGEVGPLGSDSLPVELRNRPLLSEHA